MNFTSLNILPFVAALVSTSTAFAAEAAPLPPPPPAEPMVILTERAIDGAGGNLRCARIDVANGKIVSLTAPTRGKVIDLRG